MPTLSNVHTERVFEDELCAHLVANGWSIRTHLKDATGYSRELALFPDDLLAFVQETQPAEWAKFKKWHNGQSEKIFVKRVAEQLDKHGTLHLLRSGFKDRDAKFFLCQFRPAHFKNQQLMDWYQANHLTCIRQLHYSLHNENSIDLVLFVNGLPVATSELKTDMTQNIVDAVNQYKHDRHPKDPKTKEPEALLQFKTRALVHFAVSTDEAYMATRLAGPDTRFLPFNLGKPDGLGGRGAGNPAAPDDKGYPTWYLWEKIWNRDVWLEILGNFLHLKREEVEVAGKKVISESLIFPRYHQLDAVVNLVYSATHEGAGQTYLVQHSAGSGKSNTIAWTAHRLASLHDAAGKKIFDTVVVITDRKVLDRQLQETISQFEQKDGVVLNIEKDSQQLADALNANTPIIVTTLQKFSFITEKVQGLAAKCFALIVDEAHSSQTGAAAKNAKKALTSGAKKPPLTVTLAGDEHTITPDVAIDPEEVTAEDVINEVMASRARPTNVSYFAFTATPKPKTLELFGRPGKDGVPEPFHVYSMRQAIEEGFIMDVLKNYVSYAAYYKLGSQADQKLVPAGKAKKSLARFASLHETNIAQKVVVIVEHFRTHVMPKIGGKAKAMVVTSGRVAAVRYKLAMDRYLKDLAAKDPAYAQMGTLVAYSGNVKDADSGPDEFTESSMNAVHGREPAEAFEEDDYRLLLVANKYQTGFDQPLLHTMYVDKKLSGVLAVQTLSRLNRVCSGKNETFVLDFVNKPEDILASFKPYYRTAELEDVTDPNLVHELHIKLDQAKVYHWNEVEAFAKAFFDPKRKQSALHGHLKPAYDRWKDLDAAEAEQFRKNLGTFLRMYDFLSQIIPYDDVELEQLYAFGKHLMPRLVEHGGGGLPDLAADVKLTHYRLQKLGEQTLDLETGDVVKLSPSTGAGPKARPSDDEVALREIVEKMNDLFSGSLTEADLVGYVATMKGKLLANDRLADQAASNTEEQFALGDFPDILTDIVIEGQEAHNAIADQLLQDKRIFAAMQGMLARMVYRAFQNKGSA